MNSWTSISDLTISNSIKGVFPSLSYWLLIIKSIWFTLRSRSAPLNNNSFIILFKSKYNSYSYKYLAIAMCIGVLPSKSYALGSAPKPNKHSTHLYSLFKTAKCKGVPLNPSFTLAFIWYCFENKSMLTIPFSS